MGHCIKKARSGLGDEKSVSLLAFGLGLGSALFQCGDSGFVIVEPVGGSG